MKKIAVTIKTLLLVLLCAALVFASGRILARKESTERYGDFSKLAGQVDVIFLGPSHTQNAINPAQLYRDYGITSYNLGMAGGMLSESYWQLRRALDYSTPMCVVVDVWAMDRDWHYDDTMGGLYSEEDIGNKLGLLHTGFDSWPLSKTKAEAVADLVQSPSRRMEYLWTFPVYHSRWSQLTAEDYTMDESNSSYYRMLGTEIRRELLWNPDVTEPDDTAQKLPAETDCEEYLVRIIDLCKERGMQVMLSYMPVAESRDADVQSCNTAAEIAARYQIPFADLRRGNGIVDFAVDMADTTHVNQNGQYKVTDYFGKLLSDPAFGIPDHSGDPGYRVWDEYAAWQEQKDEAQLTADNDPYILIADMMRLGTPCILYIGEDSPALSDPELAYLISWFTGTEVVRQAAEADGPYLLIKSSGESALGRDTGESAPGREDGSGTGGNRSGAGGADVSDGAETGMPGEEETDLSDGVQTGVSGGANGEARTDAYAGADMAGAGTWNAGMIEFAGEQQTGMFATILGETEYIGVSGFGAVYANGDESANYLDMDEHYDDSLQIILLNEDGTVRCGKYFRYRGIADEG